MNEKEYTDLALSFPGTEMATHFNRIGYHAKGKRMFATYLDENNTAKIFLSTKEQGVFRQMDKGIYLFPINGVKRALLRLS